MINRVQMREIGGSEHSEQLVRTVNAIGNGAHIFAPKEWLGEEICIIRTRKKEVKEQILEVLAPFMEYVKGAYLYGSRARGEAGPESDIDLFVITSKKLTIKKEGFEIIALEEKSIEKAIEISPLMIYSILSEAKPIINSELLEIIKEKYPFKKSNIVDYFEETKRIININKDLLKLDKKEGKSAYEGIIYSLILRLRGLFIIKCLLKGKLYSKKDFRKWIELNVKGIDYNNFYDSYLAVKMDKKIKSEIPIADAENLLIFLEKEVKKYNK